jgi:hypothetical protein
MNGFNLFRTSLTGCPMLELIGGIVLVYYLVLGVAVLIFLAWGYLEDYRHAKWRRRGTRNGNDERAQPGREPESDPTGQAKQAGRPPDNVVRFKRRK